MVGTAQALDGKFRVLARPDHRHHHGEIPATCSLMTEPFSVSVCVIPFTDPVCGVYKIAFSIMYSGTIQLEKG